MREYGEQSRLTHQLAELVADPYNAVIARTLHIAGKIPAEDLLSSASARLENYQIDFPDLTPLDGEVFNRQLAGLQEAGLIVVDPQRQVALTREGREIANMLVDGWALPPWK